MSTSDELDVAVVGAGVVGLAIARALALAGREVLVIEAENAFGMHTSSRNSEVIHAGIYYPVGTLKASLCVAGKEALYDYCAREDVPHRRVGKLVVATRDEEIPTLEKTLANARANGVLDLTWIAAAELRELEPNVRAVRGLFSPSTGIIDSHELMAAYRRDAIRAGAQVVLATPVLGGSIGDGHISLDLGGVEPKSVRFRSVVNAAGLRAPTVSRSIAGVAPVSIPSEHFAKGHYCVLNGRAPFRHLIYPVPVPGGLGVHVTLDLAGHARFGPDVSWVPDIDYTFDETRIESFYQAIREYYPALADGSLSPGYTGIRPKLGGAGSSQDFEIHGPSLHQVPGFVALYGIESPGLTASLAIADRVVAALAG